MNFYVDTAASGMWKWDKSTLDPSQPSLIRLAWGTSVEGSEKCMLIFCGVPVAQEATEMHGIASIALHVDGAELADVLAAFRADLAASDADAIVGFSWDFHRKLLEKAFDEAGMLTAFPPNRICAMRAAAPVVQVRMQRNKQWAWPKMTEAHRHFVGEDFVRSENPIAAGIQQIVALRRIHEGTLAATGAV